MSCDSLQSGPCYVVAACSYERIISKQFIVTNSHSITILYCKENYVTYISRLHVSNTFLLIIKCCV